MKSRKHVIFMRGARWMKMESHHTRLANCSFCQVWLWTKHPTQFLRTRPTPTDAKSTLHMAQISVINQDRINHFSLSIPALHDRLSENLLIEQSNGFLTGASHYPHTIIEIIMWSWWQCNVLESQNRQFVSDVHIFMQRAMNRLNGGDFTVDCEV